MTCRLLLKWFALASTLAALGATGAETLRASPGPGPIPEAFDAPDVPLPNPDLWQRVRKGFVLDAMESPLVLEHEQWYANRPDFIRRLVDRGSLYLHHIVQEVERRGMPMEIALLPVVESAFNPHALSSSKASGLWQFIPSTGRNYGLEQDWWKDNRRDIVAATDAALNYLQALHDLFGNWELALAAYNCGEGCVGRAIAANQRLGLPTDFQSLKLPSQTLNYVPKLLAVKNIVLAPAMYGIELESIPDKPYFTTVEVPGRIDVKLAARLAGMRVDEFTALNPAHNKPVAHAPAGTLVVPMDRAQAFRENLENWDQPLVSWHTVEARKGESIHELAKRYGLSSTALRQTNDLQVNKRGRLLASQPILVPASAKAKSTLADSPGGAGASGRQAQASPGPAGVYTVKAGDTLYSIAQRFRRAVPDLLRHNNLTARATIHPGLRLHMP